MSRDIKIKLTYAYNGAQFCGSQTQPHGRSVEDALDSALARLGIFERVITSSRTDKGVHALNQVSAVHCASFWQIARLRDLINRHAAPYIFVKKIEVVSEDFQPRYDAKMRSYRYVLNHGEFDPFLSDFCLFHKKGDLRALNAALRVFVGRHDFSAFMKSGSDVKSCVREIYAAYAFAHKNCTIIKFRADGFLRAQVRLMVANALKSLELSQSRGPLNFKDPSSGSLNFQNGDCGIYGGASRALGSGNEGAGGELSAPSDENSTKVGAKDRTLSIDKALTRIPAPPNGLYLERVFY